jgi:hypothetical protein
MPSLKLGSQRSEGFVILRRYKIMLRLCYAHKVLTITPEASAYREASKCRGSYCDDWK